MRLSTIITNAKKLLSKERKPCSDGIVRHCKRISENESDTFNKVNEAFATGMLYPDLGAYVSAANYIGCSDKSIEVGGVVYIPLSEVEEAIKMASRCDII